ncbi:MAG: triose-phosphate isomerase [Candidatus Izemoplasmatales bacterium]|jgi:triosephosphate isomerase|nr:triose-phosphate isomerase [Candidatus Izemoplasmatales bacterium]
MRKPIIAGNWKMYKTRDEALFFILKVSDGVPSIKDVDSVICAQAPLMRCLIKRQGDNLRIGAQNMHYADEGAFTGEVSGPMLKSYNVDYVIIGHSERRAMFYETDEIVNKKIVAALRNDLIPIVCIGEHLEERENGSTNAILHSQIMKGFVNIDAKDMKKIIIAYEPIWAIGTGKTATADLADETCGYIRSVIGEVYGADVAEAIRIQYGGSVNPGNIDELLSKANIDGVLIGGASLNPDHFIYMTNAAMKRLK